MQRKDYFQQNTSEKGAKIVVNESQLILLKISFFLENTTLIAGYISLTLIQFSVCGFLFELENEKWLLLLSLFCQLIETRTITKC